MTKRQTKRVPTLGVRLTNMLLTLAALIATVGGWVGLSASAPAVGSPATDACSITVSSDCEQPVADRGR